MRAVILLIFAVVAFSHEFNDDSGRNAHPGGASAGVDYKMMKNFVKHIQCRQCVHTPRLTNPNHPMPARKWCAVSKLNDYDGTCLEATKECPKDTIVMSLEKDCPNDAPETKKSCTLCMLDGYEWCHPPMNDFQDEYEGECVMRPAAPTPAPVPPTPPSGPDTPAPNPNPEPPHPMDAADTDTPTPPVPNPNPVPTPPINPIQPTQVCKSGMFATQHFFNCPVVANQRPIHPVGPDHPMPTRGYGQHGKNPAAFIVPILLISVCLGACCFKRRRDRRRRELAALQALQAGSQESIAMPIAQPVQMQPIQNMHVQQPMGYEMPQAAVTLLGYPVLAASQQQVVHTGPAQPLRYGPMISAPTSFLSRDEVEMQGRPNGYAQVSQLEP